LGICLNGFSADPHREEPVFNIKVSAVAAGIAFFLSFLVGIIRGAAILIVLLRALIFAVLFFVCAAGIHILLKRFLPELLESGEAAGEIEGASGSRVDISLGDPEKDLSTDLFSLDEMENSGGTGESSGPAGPNSPENMGLDQNGEDDYTNRGEPEVNSPNSGADSQGESVPGEPAALPADSGPVDALPDFGSIGEGAFDSSSGEAAEESADYVPAKPPAKGKPNGAGGDFNPKELASALQTILKRE
jgi:hypothetical protein